MDEVEGNVECVGSIYKGFVGDVIFGMMLLFDDGNMSLWVDYVCGNDIQMIVLIGGMLKNNKGINVFEVDLIVFVLLEKDVQDMEFGVSFGVDWVVLSFVCLCDDLLFVWYYFVCFGSCVKLMVKIEKLQVVDCFVDIFKEVDGVMVVCGDFGVEMCFEQVLIIQKCIICMCCEVGKLVIMVIQMFESMINLLCFICVEVLDVVNVIYDGIDVVMFFVELVVGQYLVELVVMMDCIVCEVEVSEFYQLMQCQVVMDIEQVQDVIVFVVCNIGVKFEVFVIVIFISMGGVVICIFKNCLLFVIVVLIFNEIICNQFVFFWGVYFMFSEDFEDIDDMVCIVNDELKKSGLVDVGDCYVIMVGVFFGVCGIINMLCVEKLKVEDLLDCV